MVVNTNNNNNNNNNSNKSTRNSNNNSNNNSKSNTGKYCAHHRSTGHNTAECNAILNNPMLKVARLPQETAPGQGQQVNTTTMNGYSFMFPTRVSIPQHILSMRG